MNDQQRIIIDVEGGNSSERGDQSDETREALACFALAVSDIVILNIKADQLHSQAMGLNLLRTINRVARRIYPDRFEVNLAEATVGREGL
jgi:hypothetical protein